MAIFRMATLFFRTVMMFCSKQICIRTSKHLLAFARLTAGITRFSTAVHRNQSQIRLSQNSHHENADSILFSSQILEKMPEDTVPDRRNISTARIVTDS
jgi:hypothetical protein